MLNIDSIEIKEGDNFHWYRETTPEYNFWPAFNYSDPEFSDGSNYQANVFNHAHNEGCSCSNGYIDTVIGTPEFKLNQTIEAKLRRASEPCSDKMQDFECYFFMRYLDRLDLAIDNIARMNFGIKNRDNFYIHAIFLFPIIGTD